MTRGEASEVITIIRGEVRPAVQEEWEQIAADVCVEALDLAIAALRGPTREQVEQVRGEWTTDGVCSRCGFDAMYYKGVPVQVRTNYCPACGAPMTDEAVETIMKRMEEMRND